MKEQVEEKQISEAAPSNTERAQKQIAQKKKLRAQKQLQSKKDTAKKAMQSKSDEMNILMKARLADFKKKAGTQTKKLTKQQTSDSIQLDGDKMISEGQDAIQGILNVAKESDHPRGYEVAGNLIKQVAEVTEKLGDLQEKMKKLKEVPNSAPKNVTNALFVGSTAELQKMLKGKTDE